MELKFVLEAVLFAAPKPMNSGELRGFLIAAAEFEEPAAKAYKKVKLEEVNAALEELARECEQAQRSYRLVCVAGAWQFVSQPEYAPWLKAMLGQKNRPARLSQAALETLAIVAYRQPLTRAEIEQIRGVSVDGVMQTLLDRGLIETAGRAETVGHPMTYGTKGPFLEYFGLRSLEDLPAADELRRIPIEKPPALLTVEAGLATATPEQLSLDAAAATSAGATEPAAESATPPVAAATSESAPEAAAGEATAPAPAEPPPATS